MAYKPTLKKGCCYAGTLADLAGLPLATVVYYSRIGLLPTEKRTATGRPRLQYPQAEALKRLGDIAKLKKRHKNIPEICAAFGIEPPTAAGE